MLSMLASVLLVLAPPSASLRPSCELLPLALQGEVRIEQREPGPLPVPDLENYEVHLHAVDGRTRGALEHATAEPGTPGVEVSALGGGRFIARVTGESFSGLSFSAPGFADTVALLSRGRGTAEHSLEVALFPPDRIEGLVLDEAGRPVEGVRVDAAAFRMTGRIHPAWLFPSRGFTERASATSDELGRVVLEDLPPLGEWSFFLGGELVPGSELVPWDGAAEPVPIAHGGTVHLTWHVPPERVVRGRVLDEAGRSLSGVRVGLLPRKTFYRVVPQWPAHAAPHEALTGTDGTFRMEAVREGSYHLRVLQDAPVGSLALPIDVEAASEQREHRLLAGRHWIEGRVLGADEEHSSVPLLLEPLDPRRAPLGWVVAEGPAFRLGPLPRGRYELRIGFDHRSRHALVVEAGATDVELELPSLAHLRVRPMVDGAPHPVLACVWTELEGTVEVCMPVEEPLELEAGEHTLVVRSYDARIGVARVVLAAGEERELEVPLQPGALLEVELAGDTRAARLFIEHDGLRVDELELARGLPQELLLPAERCLLRLEALHDGAVLFQRELELEPRSLERIVIGH